MRAKNLLRAVVATLAAVVLLLEAQPALAAEVEGVTDDTIKIGMFFVLTGPASVYGIGTRNSAVMIIDEVNKAGGVNGRKIEYVIEDDGCAASKALAAVKKLVTRDKVFAIFGGICSGATAAVIPLINESKIPLFVAMAVTRNITNPYSTYIFRANLPSDSEGPLMVDFAMKEFKPKKIAMIYQTDEYGVESSSGVEPRLKEKYKMELVAKEAHKIGDADFSAQILRMRAANPDVVLIHSYLKEASIILRQAQELGLKAKFMLSIAAAHPIISELAGKEAVAGKAIGITPLVDDIDGPKLASFVGRYRKYYPLHSQRPGIPNLNDIHGFGAIQLFLEALRKAGRDLSREKFIAAMESLRNFKTNAYAPVSFSKDDHDGNQGAYFWKFKEDASREFIDKFYPWKGQRGKK